MIFRSFCTFAIKKTYDFTNYTSRIYTKKNSLMCKNNKLQLGSVYKLYIAILTAHVYVARIRHSVKNLWIEISYMLKADDKAITAA